MDQEYQAMLLNYMVKVPSLYKYFHEFQSESHIAQTFGYPQIKFVLNVFKHHHKEYGELPTLPVLNRRLQEHNAFRLWKSNEATDSEISKFNIVVSKIYEPLKDKEFIRKQIKNLLIVSHALHYQKKEIELRNSPGSDPVQIFSDLTKERQRFLNELEIDLDGSNEDSVFLSDAHDHFDMMQGIVPYKTKHKSINMYRNGMTLLVSDAKMYKSGVSIDLIIDMVRDGMDVILFDLENGLYQMLTRVVQAYLNIEREWIYSNTYVDREKIVAYYRNYENSNMMPILEFNYDRLNPSDSSLAQYEEGTVVYKIETWKNTEQAVGNGFNMEGIQWHTKVKFYTVYRSDISSQGGLARMSLKPYEGPISLPDGVYRPLKPMIKEVFDDLKKMKGNLKIRYVKKPTPLEIEKEIKHCITDQSEGRGFYKDEYSRVAVIDWLALMKGSNPRDPVWQQMRQNYIDLKEIRKEHNVSMLAIEGVSNPEVLAEPTVNAWDIKTMNSRRSSFDAEALVALCATSEEKKNNVRRIESLFDRYSKSESSYMVIDPKHQQLRVIDDSEYINICQETAEARGMVLGDSEDTDFPSNPDQLSSI